MTETNTLHLWMHKVTIWCLVIMAGSFVVKLHAAEPPDQDDTANETQDEAQVEGYPEQNKFHDGADEYKLQLEAEINCLALNIYFEARSEPHEGQYAVGHVVMNRVASQYYPNTVCGVVQQGGELRLHGCQFSWWCDGRPDMPRNKRAWLQSLQIAQAIYSGNSKDPTYGALWYHADYVSPFWKDTLSVAVRIGQHIFYQKKRKSGYLVN
jgi:spore germination cell wall hydrolase CwlJ-like protein